MSDWSAQTVERRRAEWEASSGWGIRDERCRGYSCESCREEREGVVHAVVGQVKIDTSREDEARKLLDEMVLPTSKALAGGPPRPCALQVGEFAKTMRAHRFCRHDQRHP
jgi:hypothetical protein